MPKNRQIAVRNVQDAEQWRLMEGYALKIRIKFTKQGAMKFVGHLDLMRYFQKAMRRADVDICYSEGFSPHQIMSFAAPLGVGLTSKGEYLDIEVKHSDASDEMIKRLNETMAEGISVLSFKKLPDTAKNAMSIVAAADYRLTFREGYVPEEMDVWLKGLSVFLEQDSIPYMKKTKKGVKELNLKHLIYQYQIDKEGIFLQVSAGSSDNLKPEMVINAYYQSLDQELMPLALLVERQEVYADLGSEEERKLVPLNQLGEDLE